MYKRSPLAYIIAALSCATIIALCVLLPRCLSRNHQSALLGTTQVEPLEAMPVETAPTPLPEEALVDRAIARQNQSAQFVNLQEDVEPSAEELDRAAVMEKLSEQMKRLIATDMDSIPEASEMCYYRLVHGVTADYQGFYSIEYKDNTNAGEASVVVKGKGNYTGTCEKTFTISARSIAMRFANL